MRRRDLGDLLLEDDHAQGCPASRIEAETLTRTDRHGRPEVVTVARCQDCGGQRVHLGDVEHNLTVAEVTIGPSSDELSAANMRTQQRRVSRLMARRRRAYRPSPTNRTVVLREPRRFTRERSRRRSSRSRRSPGHARRAPTSRAGPSTGDPDSDGPGDAGPPHLLAAFGEALAELGATPAERLTAFGRLPQRLQAAAWASLRRAADRDRDR